MIDLFSFLILCSSDEALIALRDQLFSRSDLPAIPLLITPQLARRSHFPASRYIELINTQSSPSFDGAQYQHWKLYQLHAFLLILDQQQIEQIPSTLIKRIVSIIRFYIHGVIQSNRYYSPTIQDADADEHERDDAMDVDNGGFVC